MPASFAARTRPALITSASVAPGTTTTPSAVTDDPVARLDQHPAALDRCPHRPALGLARAAQRDHRREHREPVGLDLGDVAHATVDHETSQAARLRAGREHLTPVAELAEVADVDDERVTRLRPGRPRRGSRGCRPACTAPGTPAPRAGRRPTRRGSGPASPAPRSRPSVAAPSSSSACVTSTSADIPYSYPPVRAGQLPIGGGRGI